MPEPYAWTLFQQLVHGGEAELLAQLRRTDPEHDYLDFKQIVSNPALYTAPTGARLDQDDLPTLGKALSGFANTLGGVIVWGIKCLDKDKPHTRKLEPGIQHAEAFKGVLRRLIGSATVPGLSGVELEVVALPTLGPGYSAVLMYVPQREFGPVMSHAGGEKTSHKYFFRSGDSFQPLTHQMLAAMFGRSPPPIMSLQWFIMADEPCVVSGAVVLNIGLRLANDGDGMGFHPYVVVDGQRPSDASQIKFPEDRIDSRFFAHSSFMSGASFLGRAEFPLAPGEKILVAWTQIFLNPPFNRKFIFKVVAGARDALPYRRDIVVGPEQLEAIIARAPDLTTKELWKELRLS